MRKPFLLAEILAAGAILSACGLSATACPAIAQATAVSITVSANYAPQVGVLHFRACQDGRCTEADIDLRPGSASIDQGCTPEGACSATASPDGTKVGALKLEALTESPMTVSTSGTTPEGTALPVRTLELRPRAMYPFGEQCGRVLSAAVTLDADGLRQAA